MEFKVLDLIKYYLKNILTNIIVLLVVFLLGLVYIFSIHEDKYVANTTFMLGACFHGCKEEAHLSIDFNKKVLLDYMELIKSNKVLTNASNYSDLGYKASELQNMVKVSYEEETEYITITVTSKDKNDAALLANNLYSELADEIKRIFGLNNIHLVDYDTVGSVKDSMLKLVVIDFIIAFLITIMTTLLGFLFFPKLMTLIKKIPRKAKRKTKKIKNKTRK